MEKRSERHARDANLPDGDYPYSRYRQPTRITADNADGTRKPSDRVNGIIFKR